MATRRSALGLFVAAVVMFFSATFVAELWSMAATVLSVLCGTAALLLYLVARARSGMHDRL